MRSPTILLPARIHTFPKANTLHSLQLQYNKQVSQYFRTVLLPDLVTDYNIPVSSTTQSATVYVPGHHPNGQNRQHMPNFPCYMPHSVYGQVPLFALVKWVLDDIQTPDLAQLLSHQKYDAAYRAFPFHPAGLYYVLLFGHIVQSSSTDRMWHKRLLLDSAHKSISDQRIDNV